jgi:hypothetical protein
LIGYFRLLPDSLWAKLTSVETASFEWQSVLEDKLSSESSDCAPARLGFRLPQIMNVARENPSQRWQATALQKIG